MEINYKPTGVCVKNMMIDIEGDTVKSVKFIGGCSGNLQGIGALVKNMKVSQVIEKLEGIRCGVKPTSCPDQLAKALKENI